LPVISGKEALKALERAGFVVVRQRGSHVRIKKVYSLTVHIMLNSAIGGASPGVWGRNPSAISEIDR